MNGKIGNIRCNKIHIIVYSLYVTHKNYLGFLFFHRHERRTVYRNSKMWTRHPPRRIALHRNEKIRV